MKDDNNQFANMSAFTTPLAAFGAQAAGLLAPGTDVDLSNTRTRRLYVDPITGAEWNRPLRRNQTPGRANLRFAKLAIPANAALGAFDYFQGKAEGEDDVRAATGAIGSTLGSIGGGAAAGVAFGRAAQAISGGAASGERLGRYLGPRGRLAGAVIGGIGSIAGSLLGGWGSDRIDEAIRNK